MNIELMKKIENIIMEKEIMLLQDLDYTDEIIADFNSYIVQDSNIPITIIGNRSGLMYLTAEKYVENFFHDDDWEDHIEDSYEMIKKIGGNLYKKFAKLLIDAEYNANKLIKEDIMKFAA